ncbi:MAG: DoxX family protein [Pseudomonadota bacterium]|nr:DoxX family protein [Pseudomonadota bacterium]
MSSNAVLLVARILLSVMFIMAGASKFAGIAGTAAYLSSVGLPAPTLLAWLTAVFEVVAGLAVLLGFMTRYASWALAAFCVVAAILFHANFADQMQMTMFMKNFAIAGGFLALAIAGPGAISVDARRGTA